MRQYPHIPKQQRQYDYNTKPVKPVVLKDLKSILGELYGDTYTGPYVRLTKRDAFEARVRWRKAKRLAKQEATRLPEVEAAHAAFEAQEERRRARRLAEQEASIDTIESLDTDSASMCGLVTPR